MTMDDERISDQMENLECAILWLRKYIAIVNPQFLCENKLQSSLCLQLNYLYLKLSLIVLK